MGNKTIFRVVMCIIILSTFILPVSAQQPDKTNEYEVSLKKLMEVTGASASIDEVLSYTLSVAKMNVSEFESPLGERYKESAMGIMREAMPLLVNRLQMDMGKELHPEIDRSTEVVDQTRNRDQEIYDAAYALPKDSIEIADRPYNRATGTKPLLYSIERRAKDTKVTFLQPIYFDWQWLYYSPGFVIIDRKTGDEYHVRGYDGGAPQDRLLTVEGFNSKYIYVSLLFPKLKKSVEVIDILELPHEKDKLPSNDDGIAKSYYDVKVKDYLSFSNKRGKKIYY
ncbi:hypothetical protein [Bacteroides intestinalis]|uniref:DUF4296 domain-containing protein n=1 Tax=Bacteroides intestinalis TaxID=329854 RepID=A0A139LIR6_9BACE|nr:hypothetical protein [Bacteroides intestinalis]KXT51293.1 hypothetical protein HMPREF2531_02081 [Bacteroides intestinalis]